jgi:2-hydroxy-3-keto-5-methylthiopentenyl-1-phosphate phosphatase
LIPARKDITPDHQNKPLALLVYFDGTITTRDIGDLVVKEFAEPGWESLMDLYRAGEISGAVVPIRVLLASTVQELVYFNQSIPTAGECV